MSMQLCIRCIISGTVQGVGYRASAKREASQYAIKGWAKNLPSGQVEVMACGREEDLALFFAWLKKGPLNAQVSAATYDSLPWVEHQDFLVL